MLNKNKQLKQAKVQEIKERLEKSQAVILADYHGLTVEEDTELRKKLREVGVEYKVFKNTLSILALKQLGVEGLEQHLVGPLAMAISYDDPTVPARILNDFAKNHKNLELKAGLVQGEIYDLDKIKQLATIPSREVLLAKLLGSFKAPVSNFAYLLNAIKEKKESETAE